MHDDRRSRAFGQPGNGVAHQFRVGMGENRLLGGIVRRSELVQPLYVLGIEIHHAGLRLAADGVVIDVPQDRLQVRQRLFRRRHLRLGLGHVDLDGLHRQVFRHAVVAAKPLGLDDQIGMVFPHEADRLKLDVLSYFADKTHLSKYTLQELAKR